MSKTKKTQPKTDRRPQAGGRWIRTPDGRLVDERSWQAEQARAAQAKEKEK